MMERKKIDQITKRGTENCPFISVSLTWIHGYEPQLDPSKWHVYHGVRWMSALFTKNLNMKSQN